MEWGVNLINKVFAPTSCILGEGIYFDESSRHIYWVDIINSIIYRKNVDLLNDSYDFFSIGSMPSAVLSVEDEIITFVDRFGIGHFDLNTHVTELLYETPYTESSGFRANDAVKLQDGSMLYGTMYFKPGDKSGKLYKLESGKVNEIEDLSFSIPNTFIELEENILISDSLEQRVYSLNKDFKNKIVKTLWKDFSDEHYTPDGGCVDRNGNIYISMWDGFCVRVFDKDARPKYKIELPVPRPTNCILVDERWLYVTSAREGMSEESLNLYPSSGNVFVVDLGAVSDQ